MEMLFSGIFFPIQYEARSICSVLNGKILMFFSLKKHNCHVQHFCVGIRNRQIKNQTIV